MSKERIGLHLDWENENTVRMIQVNMRLRLRQVGLQLDWDKWDYRGKDKSKNTIRLRQMRI